MTIKNFIRRDSNRYSKIGKKRKKLQVWRKPKGRDNKMRLKRHGYPKTVSIGYRTNKSDRGKLKNKVQRVVYNMEDLGKTEKDSVVIIGKVGAKKKIELVKKAAEMKLEVVNIKTEENKNAVK